MFEALVKALRRRPWPKPWRAVRATEARALVEELACVLEPGHMLHGAWAAPVARRDDEDKALLALPDGALVEVRLGSAESVRFASAEDWLSRRGA